MNYPMGYIEHDADEMFEQYYKQLDNKRRMQLNTLQEILAIEAQIENQLIENDGEISQEIETLIQEVCERKEEKIKNYCNFLEFLDNKVEQAKEKKNYYAERQKILDNQLKRMKENLKFNMQQRGIDKIETNDFKISLQNSPKSLIIDENASFDNKYYVYSKEVDKTKLKAALSAGEEIEGASLQHNQSLRIKAV